MTDTLTEFLRTEAEELISAVVEAELCVYWPNLQRCGHRLITRFSCAIGIILNALFKPALAP